MLETSLVFKKGFSSNDRWAEHIYRHGLFPGIPIGHMHHFAVRDHKILFTLMYDRPIDLSGATIEDARFCMAQVTVLANFYAVLPSVAYRIIALLKGLEGFWNDVATFPWFYLSLATVLCSKEIWTQAFMHAAAQYDGRNSVPDGYGREQSLLDLDQLRLLITGAQEFTTGYKNETVARIVDVCGTPLHPEAVECEGGEDGPSWMKRISTFFHMMRFNKTNKLDIGEEKIKFMARNIFRDWLTKSLFGNVYMCRDFSV